MSSVSSRDGAVASGPAADLDTGVTTYVDGAWQAGAGEEFVSVDPATGEVQTTLTAVLSNDAPDSGLPDYLIGNGELVPRGTNRDLLSLFTPLSLTSLTVDGQPTGVMAQSQFGGRVYAVPVDIPSGGQVTVVYTLSGPAPSGLVDTGTYTLEVLPQPMARPDTWSVVISDGSSTLAAWQGPLRAPLQMSASPADG